MARLSSRIVQVSGGASDPLNAYDGSSFEYINDWQYSRTMYQSLHSGLNPINLGDYTVVWEAAGGTARIIPLTGSQRIGLCGLNTGETADGQLRVTTCAMGGFDSLKYARITQETVGAFDAKATVGEDHTTQVGLVGNPAFASPAEGYGCFFRYKRSVGGHKWIAVCKNLDVETALVLDGTTQSGLPTVDTETIDAYSLPSYGFYKLKVVAHADSNGAPDYAEFFVASTATGFEYVLAATIDTNMPTHSLASSVEILKTAGTTTRYFALDYTRLRYDMRTGQVRE